MTLFLPAGSLERAARRSGLRVVVLDGAESRRSGGDFGLSCTRGVLCHHTGSYDSLTDAEDDLSYAKWMGLTGRPDLDPPLCNLALSAECVVYVVAYGNANHAGTARASGPMPAGDGNELYVGIEAMNSGAQGWDSVGQLANGDPVTQGEAYARLCAGLCLELSYPADHVRAHKETSVTGKWDPGLLDMNDHRAAVARWMTDLSEEDEMSKYDEQLDRIEKLAKETAGKVDRLERARVSTMEWKRGVGRKLKGLKVADQGAQAKLDEILAELTDDDPAAV